MPSSTFRTAHPEREDLRRWNSNFPCGYVLPMDFAADGNELRQLYRWYEKPSDKHKGRWFWSAFPDEEDHRVLGDYDADGVVAVVPVVALPHAIPVYRYYENEGKYHTWLINRQTDGHGPIERSGAPAFYLFNSADALPGTPLLPFYEYAWQPAQPRIFKRCYAVKHKTTGNEDQKISVTIRGRDTVTDLEASFILRNLYPPAGPRIYVLSDLGSDCEALGHKPQRELDLTDFRGFAAG